MKKKIKFKFSKFEIQFYFNLKYNRVKQNFKISIKHVYLIKNNEVYFNFCTYITKRYLYQKNKQKLNKRKKKLN